MASPLRPRPGQSCHATQTRAIFTCLWLAVEVGESLNLSAVPGCRTWIVPADRAEGGWTVDVIPRWIVPVGTRDAYSLRERARLRAFLAAADEPGEDEGEGWKEGACP